MVETSGRRALVLAWYALAIGVFLGPAALHLDRVIIGDELSGAWRALWAHQWTLRHLQIDGAWPLYATEVAFPRQGPFSSIAPVSDALSLLPQVLFGLVPAYNLVVLFHWMLAATGGYALARQVGASPAGALSAGTVLGWNSFLLSYGIASAVVETATVGWVVWFFVALLRLIRAPCVSRAVAVGLLFAVAGLASLYWSLLTALLVPVVALPGLWEVVRAGRVPWPRLLGHALLAVGVAALAFFPLAGPLLDTYAAQGAVLQDYATRKQELLDAVVMADLAHDYATIQGFLLPGKGHIIEHIDMDRLIQSTYLGWLPLLLASLGLRRGALRWGLLALLGAVLALGPFINVHPGAGTTEPTFLYEALRALIPPLRMVTSYVRFDVFTTIGLAALAGLGADQLLGWLGGLPLPPRGLRVAVGLGLSALILVEVAVISPVPFPIPSASAEVPAASLLLARLPIPGAVLDWPQRYPGMTVEVSRYFFYQAAHQRPIPYDFAPTNYMPGAIEGNPFFALLERQTYGEDYYSGAWSEETDRSPVEGLWELRDMGFAYLVLHPAYIDPVRLSAVEGSLDGLLRVVGTTPGGETIYDLARP